MILSFGGKSPRDEGAAFVADNATVQGDVLLKPGTTVWYGAVLRGDSGTLTIGENTNIQDNAVLHCDAGGKVLLGRNVTVGHCALVHGCTVGDDSLIGMHWCRRAWSSRTIPWPWASPPGSSRRSPRSSWSTTAPTPQAMWKRARRTPRRKKSEPEKPRPFSSK